MADHAVLMSYFRQATREEGNERLLLAAAIVRDAPSEQFSINHLRVPSCASPSCVLGHYAADSRTPFTFYKDNLALLNKNIQYSGPTICGHFDITPEEAHELFGEDGCNNAFYPEDAAKYITDFVAKRVLADKSDI